MAIDDAAIGDFDLPDTEVVLPHRMTEEEFVAWCDEDTRAEWVDGEVIMMSPMNDPHSDMVNWLGSLLRIFTEEHDLGIVRPEMQTRFARLRRRRVPDIWFVTNQRKGLIHRNHLEGPPDLAIEIVSPDSEARDWREKYQEYEAAGVREYWVIDPASQHMEAYALGSAESQADQPAAGNRYRRLPEERGVITSVVLPGFRLRVDWLWPETRVKVLEALAELGIRTGPDQA
jgi:Uma2 family endonuclease